MQLQQIKNITFKDACVSRLAELSEELHDAEEDLKYWDYRRKDAEAIRQLAVLTQRRLKLVPKIDILKLLISWER